MTQEEKHRRQAGVFLGKRNKARKLFAKHLPSIGYVGEYLLRHSLKSIIPQGFGVCQGFVINNDIEDKDKLSRQCDIIIYRIEKGAVVYSVGELKIINACSVVAVIEVKSSISKETFYSTLEAFKKLEKLKVRNKFVFVFGSVSKQSLSSWFFQYKRSPQNYNGKYLAIDYALYDWSDKEWLPNSILSLESCKYYVLDHIHDNKNDWVGYASYKILDKENKEISCMQEFFATVIDLLDGSFEVDQDGYSIKDGFPLFRM